MANKLNLQPWRERQRAEQKKTFTNITVIFVILVIGLVMLDKYLQENYVASQQTSMETLKSKIDGLKKTQEEIDRLKKLNVEVQTQVDAINTLQGQRGFVVELMDFIAKGTPETIFLKKIIYGNSTMPGAKPGDKEVSIIGVAQNSSAVPEFIRNMAKWPRLGPAILDRNGMYTASSTSAYVIDPSDQEIKEFTLKIPVVTPEEGEEEAQANQQPK